jgi:hypothetical protein
MAIEQAIRKAIEGGWGALEWRHDVRIDQPVSLLSVVWGVARDDQMGHAKSLGRSAAWRRPTFARHAARPHRTAIGVTVDPENPCIFNGCMMKANS